MSEPNKSGVEELRQIISDLHVQLDELGNPPSPIAEVVDSTNTLRTNEYLCARDTILSKMISYYDAYIKELESLTNNVLSVQSELLDVLKKQSRMIKEKSDSKRAVRHSRANSKQDKSIDKNSNDKITTTKDGNTLKIDSKKRRTMTKKSTTSDK